MRNAPIPHDDGYVLNTAATCEKRTEQTRLRLRVRNAPILHGDVYVLNTAATCEKHLEPRKPRVRNMPIPHDCGYVLETCRADKSGATFEKRNDSPWRRRLRNVTCHQGKATREKHAEPPAMSEGGTAPHRLRRGLILCCSVLVRPEEYGNV